MTDIAVLEAEATRLIDEATAMAHAAGWLGGRCRLLRTTATDAIFAQIRELRTEVAEEPFPPHIPAAHIAPPTPRPAPMRTDARSREAKIHAIAAGLPVPIPAAMVDTAIANGQAVEAFALAAADYSARVRAEIAAAAAHEAAVDEMAARILGHAPAATSARAVRQTADTRTLDQAVADILAA